MNLNSKQKKVAIIITIITIVILASIAWSTGIFTDGEEDIVIATSDEQSIDDGLATQMEERDEFDNVTIEYYTDIEELIEQADRDEKDIIITQSSLYSSLSNQYSPVANVQYEVRGQKYSSVPYIIFGHDDGPDTVEETDNLVYHDRLFSDVPQQKNKMVAHNYHHNPSGSVSDHILTFIGNELSTIDEGSTDSILVPIHLGFIFSDEEFNQYDELQQYEDLIEPVDLPAFDLQDVRDDLEILEVTEEYPTQYAYVNDDLDDSLQEDISQYLINDAELNNMDNTIRFVEPTQQNTFE